MSGHSHYSTIKRKKEVEDKKKARVFSKMTQAIILAAKEGGDASLKNAIEEAKKANVPKNLIEKAIQKGSGESESERLESFIFEAYGPENIFLIIEGITDNKKRSLGEIKKILNDNKGKLVGEGAVRWQFDQKGIITIENYQNKEDLELEIIDSGAESFEWQENILKVYTKTEELEKVKENLKEEISSAFLGWVPKKKIEVNIETKEKINKLFNDLWDNESVQRIFSNLK